MAKYKLRNNGSPIIGVIDTESSSFIPNVLENVDWQQYQIWLTEGSPLNQPDPADVFVEDWDNTGRELRNQLLAETDWTQLSDVPLDYGSPTKRNEYIQYRQQLRDLPQTYPDYSTVVWPTSPTES